jgi:hypothetical protein
MGTNLAASRTILAGVLALGALGSPLPAQAADSEQPTVGSIRAVYQHRADDPVAVIFKTSGPVSRIHGSSGPLRAGAGLLDHLGSVHAVHGATSCYYALAAKPVVRQVKAGNKYKATVAIGPNSQAVKTSRMVTLHKGSFIAVARQICGSKHAILP